MKNTRIGIAMPLIVYVLLGSCKKDDDNPKDFITCKVNGKPWSAVIIDPAIPYGISYLGQNRFMLSGSESAGIPSVQVVLRDPATNNNSSGTFSIRAFSKTVASNFGSWYGTIDGYAYRTDDSTHTGTFTMTFDDDKKRASGTFSFKAAYRDTVSGEIKEIDISEGKFSTALKQLY